MTKLFLLLAMMSNSSDYIKDLSITLAADSLMERNNIVINLKYNNLSSDTIYLYTRALDMNHIQELKFYTNDTTLICCGITADTILLPSSFSKRSCNSLDSYLTTIAPFSYLELSFDVKQDLAYHGFLPDHEYVLEVYLHIEDYFKGHCNTLWTGEVKSNAIRFKTTK